MSHSYTGKEKLQFWYILIKLRWLSRSNLPLLFCAGVFFFQHVLPLCAAGDMVLSQPPLRKVTEGGTGGNAAYCSP